ncbi:chemotaxis-specific protein-glutamate methyltransferase CheB [Ideonella livida]|uniref:Protein-glutamate methylesterase/protein-glutamine glutaminase n=1 Tax=Ideonella livida TaxID=2707176 RepID=A0A7C9PFN6_9BURK|nr:chemotaxis-specific protein-glutamate methyltransferase CheB [Ideonella livida]NDY90489.1 chemotaxis-specific protein-glutamate methyltransferase CheB [Ideonella livida]
MIKLLIVDDSALMRRQLSLLFQSVGGFEIRQARNGQEAVAENRDFQPDVVTLDINMPEMDGLTALSHIMAERPVAVIMVSSLTEKGALATFEALNLGAVDYVAKPGGTISLSLDQVKDELVGKVRAASRMRMGRVGPSGGARATTVSAPRVPAAPAPRGTGSAAGLAQRLRAEREAAASARAVAGRPGLLLIGVSTGGPRALETLLPELPATFPWPVLVAQHMPATFTGPFAARLDGLCPLTVVEAHKPMAVEPGHIYIGKGGADMVLSRRVGALTVLPRPENPQHLWHPSVELLARSALEVCTPGELHAVMLTGMGNDGADGFTEIKRRGGKTIAESEESAVVWGMPGELVERGGASLVLPLDKVAAQVKAWAGR